MAKRGNSEGTIRRRSDGRWEARLFMPDGTRKSLYGATRQEVARELATAMRDREQGLSALDDRQTVGEYLAAWIESYRQRRRITSYLRYERVIRRHLQPGLGKLVLSKLTPQQVETFYTRKLAEGDTPYNVRNCHKVLRAALTDAMWLGLVHRNVASLARPPRSRSRDMAIYTEKQAHSLLNTARGTRLEAVLMLALATGMREGELLALTWPDVDLERATVLVHANLIWTKDGFTFEDGKTDHSRRRIALPSTAVEALRQHRDRQTLHRRHVEEAWTDLDLVFPNAIGRPWDASNFRNAFYRLLKRAGLPRIRPHDLRHTAATLLLAHGVNVKVVSEMLGHSSIAITLGIYGHLLPHMQREAAEVMDTLLRPEQAGEKRAPRGTLASGRLVTRTHKRN
jgi:integrase